MFSLFRGIMNDLRLESPMITSKMDGKPISIEDAIALKILLLGSACKPFPSGWIGKSNVFYATMNNCILGFRKTFL